MRAGSSSFEVYKVDAELAADDEEVEVESEFQHSEWLPPPSEPRYS